MTNRLSQETSPYLLQHKSNPVDWYPWGNEAIQKAQTENKPILLSVGYSACHWCHVMAHECFENPEIATLMNKHFINIKVDREERPDIDHIYQNVAQAMTQGGGWPLTVFLTPDLKPFFGGTYFPPDDRYGRPGFSRVLQALSEAYHNDFDGVSENAQKLTEFITDLGSIPSNPSLKKLDQGAFQKITESLLERVDWKHGGFGHAPKFPNTMLLTYLWRFGVASGFDKAGDAVRLSLTQMACGGIYDHLGGGFHRYSVDESWGVPHFEKMLYDNALLLKLYSEVLLTRSADMSSREREVYLNVLRETTQYIFREMTSPEGGFYSTQDADSEGEEGKYFVWSLEDIAQHLDPTESQVFSSRYGIEQSGNFEHGKTVLAVVRNIPELAQQLNKSEEEVKTILAQAKEKLLKARSLRVPPGRDDKILTSWNALMVSGLAWAAQALHQEGEVSEGDQVHSAAVRAFRFLTGNMEQDQGRLFSTYQNGKAKLNGYLDDYAFMAMAALDLSRFAQDSSEVRQYLESCASWIEVILKHFKDYNSSGYFFTSDDHEVLIQRPKLIFDQAIPSGNAVAVACMTALGEIGIGDLADQHEQESIRQLNCFLPSIEKNPYGMGEFLCSSLLGFMGPIVVSGKNAGALCPHPQVFQKPSDDPEMSQKYLICHRKTCGAPLDKAEEAKRFIYSTLQIKKMN